MSKIAMERANKAISAAFEEAEHQGRNLDIKLKGRIISIDGMRPYSTFEILNVRVSSWNWNDPGKNRKFGHLRLECHPIHRGVRLKKIIEIDQVFDVKFLSRAEAEAS